ncbi:unnamed protein product [Ambrosiozyma monospora]|uniref:Unnamed protein product n=1 Tax=Ambrosiozyma monospora TaxID=43982 RepID=A0ACB5U4F5_AMBMO|nr:unnamed protein product [Ambrosiozyma monospora]
MSEETKPEVETPTNEKKGPSPEQTAKDALEQLTKLRSGGAYIPPAKLRELLSKIQISKDSREYQQLQWDQLKKSLNGLINKVNKSNVKEVVVEFFGLNLIRGKGAFIKSLLKLQSLSMHYTAVYAAVICVINSKIPEIGELLVTRLVNQWNRVRRRGDKELGKATLLFISQLVNFQVCHDVIVLQILQSLLEKPDDVSVELATVLMTESGPYLIQNSKVATNAIFERFRNILNEGLIDQRVQFLVEELFNLRRTEFNGKEIIDEELDLI